MGVGMDRLEHMCMHLASWLSFDAGTRFGKVHVSDAAQDIWTGLDNLKIIHDLTGITPAIVWGNHQKGLDPEHIAKEVAKRGLRISTVHAGFEGEAISYGSATNGKESERKLALAEIESCIAVMKGTGAKFLSLWFQDGTNYPGQGNFTKRYDRMLGVLKEAYSMMDGDMTMILEYKLFEPGMYHTDIGDWGTAVALCQAIGDRAKVIVDLGHHAHGTNIPATISSVIRAGKLGAIHFNDSKYADDDLIVGALDPYRLFLIFAEMLSLEKFHGFDMDAVPLMIDQSLIVEKKLPGMLYTVANMQTAFAKALRVDQEELDKKQSENDVIGATRVLREAFETDVRSMLADIRVKNGRPADPFAALM